MHRRIITVLIGLVLLTACNLPTRPSLTPTPDAVATQVSQLLTGVPSATIQATQPAAPSSTPESSPTPTQTSVPATATLPAATATLPSGDPRNSMGQPTWEDSLETGQNFYLYENENTRVTHENGALLLTGINANGWIGWSLTFRQKPQNFYVEGTFNPQTCSGADLYGLVFRAPDTNGGYFFAVTCDGRYSLHARNFTDNSDQTLIDLTKSSSQILSGVNQTNRLGVLANGNKLSLYANGSLLQELTDSTFENQGYVGAFVAANATAGFTVRLDQISLWITQ